MVSHTVQSYDGELDTPERRIAEMGGIAEKMVIEAMDALANADTVHCATRRASCSKEADGQAHANQTS